MTLYNPEQSDRRYEWWQNDIMDSQVLDKLITDLKNIKKEKNEWAVFAHIRTLIADSNSPAGILLKKHITPGDIMRIRNNDKKIIKKIKEIQKAERAEETAQSKEQPSNVATNVAKKWTESNNNQVSQVEANSPTINKQLLPHNKIDNENNNKRNSGTRINLPMLWEISFTQQDVKDFFANLFAWRAKDNDSSLWWVWHRLAWRLWYDWSQENAWWNKTETWQEHIQQQQLNQALEAIQPTVQIQFPQWVQGPNWTTIKEYQGKLYTKPLTNQQSWDRTPLTTITWSDGKTYTPTKEWGTRKAIEKPNNGVKIDEQQQKELIESLKKDDAKLPTTIEWLPKTGTFTPPLDKIKIHDGKLYNCSDADEKNRTVIPDNTIEANGKSFTLTFDNINKTRIATEKNNTPTAWETDFFSAEQNKVLMEGIKKITETNNKLSIDWQEVTFTKQSDGTYTWSFFNWKKMKKVNMEITNTKDATWNETRESKITIDANAKNDEIIKWFMDGKDDDLSKIPVKPEFFSNPDFVKAFCDVAKRTETWDWTTTFNLLKTPQAQEWIKSMITRLKTEADKSWWPAILAPLKNQIPATIPPITSVTMNGENIAISYKDWNTNKTITITKDQAAVLAPKK